MSYFDQMMASSGMFSPQSMNYAGQQAAATSQQAGGDKGFWDKLRAWTESPQGLAQIAPALDYMLQVRSQPPGYYGMEQRQGAPLPNPGQATLNGLMAAIMQGR